ncbi:MAG: zf-HC2 domain-containing protein [Aromatoleum sp.]|jgi:anti-sigma factor RsiW|uniref:anti-sigma factor family protein n=1 Tax=Aromatoleum sp. TaxID=2307007 RepID=UPI002896201F|nr:zf-HC2 domain-containing protein [Aromatoleum sp.]MDT3671999.1 zf-HC2 domain-containing protein [Aromatoleum sp.]
MTNETCPRHVALSALIDDALAPRERAEITAHVAVCPICAAELEDFRTLSAEFAALLPEAPDFDFGDVIETRLNAQQAAAKGVRRPTFADRVRRLRERWASLLALPAASGAVALTLGLYLGSNLLPPPRPVAPRVATMAVFAPIPPGALCAVSETCLAETEFQ